MKDIAAYLKANQARLLPLAILLFLALATFLTLYLTKRSQELRSRALADTASVSFSPNTVNIAQNGTFNVSIILNTPTQAIVGADFLVKFSTSKLTLVSIARPIFGPNTVFKTYAPVTTDNSGNFDFNKVVTTANSTGTIEFGIAAFDWANESLTGPFTGTLNPVATLTFRATANGIDEIKFVHVNTHPGYTDTTDTNVVANPTGTADPEDILIQPTGTASTVNVTIGQTASPLPSPSNSPPPSGISSLTLSIRFEGVFTQRDDQTVNISLNPTVGGTAITRDVTFSANQQGIYTNSQPITGIPSNNYVLYLKGPKHITKRFDNVTIVPGTNTYTFTNIETDTLLAGDIILNDRVGSDDYSEVVALYGCPNLPPPQRPGCEFLQESDLFFDGTIGSAEFNSVVGNFDLVGDQ